jgi:monofunctional biosynthetic peptidoglycan transglycosylase
MRLATQRLLRRLAAAALLALVGLGAWVWAGLPARSEVRALARQNPGKTRLMLQREEEARAKGRRTRSTQAWVPLASVSRHLIHAVLASEDQKFFGHEGVDWQAIQESLEKNVEQGRFARGGSTITQQLAKNLYFGTARTPARKLRELVVTHWLEAELAKARILALYLNVIEWGDSLYGCEAAARHWYGKPAAQLSETEAAGLAAMIPNPRRINPRASAARHERATRRVLWLMAQAGYIGRDVAPLGAEPPAELVTEDEPPEDAAPETPASPSAPLSPPGLLSPSASPSPSVAPSPPGSASSSRVYHSGMKLASLMVSDYMTENPITVEPEEPLMRALEIIRLRGVRRLPVAVGGMLVGLITEGDLKRAEPSTLTDSQEDFTRVMEGTPISRIMISKPVTTTADTPLMEAAEIMLNTKYGALPVVADGRVVGILTDNDLTRALVDVMREAKAAQG